MTVFIRRVSSVEVAVLNDVVMDKRIELSVVWNIVESIATMFSSLFG